MKKIIPVLLAGGSGTRLWPLSRKSYPKQFSKIINEHTLFQKTALRLSTSSIIKFDNPLILTNENFRFIVGEQLRKVNIDPTDIIIEPETKNTAPAILAASLYAFKKNKKAILLVAPTDHEIPNKLAFHQAIDKAYEPLEEGNIITFGIKPYKPETGYGYLELAEKISNKPLKLNRFIEKPNLNIAKKMCNSNNYLWNAGIFIFYAKDMIKSFQKNFPSYLEIVKNSIDKGKIDLDFFRLNQKEWTKCENISIDYAIMESAKNLVTIPYFKKWSDLGSWNAVWEKNKPNKNGVVLSKNAHEIDCKNSLLRSESKDLEIVGLGLNNIMAIAMPDAVLIANKSYADKVGKVVSKLKSDKISQAEIFPKDHRPWGWFETLAINTYFQVKKIMVNPGASLSLQKHKYRSEHWVVVAGKAKTTINDEIIFLKKGQSIYVPKGAIHRVENMEKYPLVFIEIQTGTYFGEDDIERLEDIYSRK